MSSGPPSERARAVRSKVIVSTRILIVNEAFFIASFYGTQGLTLAHY